MTSSRAARRTVRAILAALVGAPLLLTMRPEAFAVLTQTPPAIRAQKGVKAPSIVAAEQRVEELRALSMEACIIADEESLEAVERCQSLAYDLQEAEALLSALASDSPLSSNDGESY